MIRRVAVRACVAGVALLSALLGAAAMAGPAAAHPLGNFTVNHYARVELSDEVIRVRYVIDQAEVPTLADAQAIEAYPDAYTRGRVRMVETGLQIWAENRPARLRAIGHRLDRPAGEGTLPTTRITIDLEAALPSGTTSPQKVRLRSTVQPGRLGWRELVVVARGNARIVSSSQGSEDETQELRAYPESRVDRPLDEREASFTFEPGTLGVPLPPLPGGDQSAPEPGDDQGTALLGGDQGTPRSGGDQAVARSGGELAALMSRQVDSPFAVALALGLAFLFGCGHAIGPGHGKSVMAAYMVGTHGRARDAVMVGLVVALMHTASSLVLGFTLLRVGDALAPERLYPWLSLGSGLCVLALGGYLCWSRFARPAHAVPGHDHKHEADHGHEYGGPGHGHGHGPGHGHGHGLPEGTSPLSWAGLVALGSAGGLLPSPSALIVLLSAATVGRMGFGLTLIVVFSAGLAATLTTVGLSLVWGRGLVVRHPRGARLVGALPRASAVALALLGVVLTIAATAQLV